MMMNQKINLLEWLFLVSTVLRIMQSGSVLYNQGDERLYLSIGSMTGDSCHPDVCKKKIRTRYWYTRLDCAPWFDEMPSCAKDCQQNKDG